MQNHEQITSKETRIRASPRVCQILLDKSCALPTSKKDMLSKKRVHLQQVGIISFAKSISGILRETS
jgi:hypothetical protein